MKLTGPVQSISVARRRSVGDAKPRSHTLVATRNPQQQCDLGARMALPLCADPDNLNLFNEGFCGLWSDENTWSAAFAAAPTWL